ncbi:MAG TPA: AmmeMemoRadiSam system radical SAM enzyme [Coriobacteriia bacterium]|nr:AmmeMemoRadiSam system radical SAM enzyme [Coriobacteriia bacterium]
MHEALLQTREGDRVRCHLCPHNCLIREGGRGVCGARGVVGGTLKALTYGLVSSVAADPIEKKPLFHFHPGSVVLSFGSVGCTMRCGHCQNWQISRPKGDDGSVGLHEVDPGAVTEMAERYGAEGVAFTYNEPIIWLEWVLDASRAAKARGLYTVMVTNGYVTAEGLDLFAEVIDAWRVDIKGFSEASFKRLCKVPHAEAVREQAERAKNVHGMHVECVTNIVPTINDSEEELRSIAEWIVSALGPETPWHVTRFIPYLEFSHLPPTPVETLERAREIGIEAGLSFVFLGNVSVPGGEDTVCPSCGARAIERRGFSLSASRIADDGRCVSCGTDLGVVVSGVASGRTERR